MAGFSDWHPGLLMTALRLRGSTPQEPEAWTPTWGTTTGAATPDFGDSDVDALFTHFGRYCHGHLGVNFGSTANFGGGTGSDNWTFSAPVPAHAPEQIVGMGEIWPDSAGGSAGLSGRMPVRVRMVDVDTFSLEISGGRVDGGAVTGGGIVDSVTPWTWAVADNLYIHFAYWTAS